MPPPQPHPNFYKQLQGVFLKADADIKPTNRNQIRRSQPVAPRFPPNSQPPTDRVVPTTSQDSLGVQQHATDPTQPRLGTVTFTFSQRLPVRISLKSWNRLAASGACSALQRFDSFFGCVLRSSVAVCSSREETSFISSRSHPRSSRRPGSLRETSAAFLSGLWTPKISTGGGNEAWKTY